jgi:integrase
METRGKTKAPGLIWRNDKPIWRASRPAIKAGFKPAWVNLSYFANDEAALVARCYRLTAEANEWITGRRDRTPLFDGTIGSLINFWQVEPSSPYHELEPATLRPYETYSRIIIRTVGARRIDALDGRDLKRWHSAWSAPSEPGGKPRLAAARMMFAIIKAALSFGISCRLAGCAELKLILQQQRFAGPRPRTVAPTAIDIEAVRKAAHDQDQAQAALAYALQFEGGMRQWDVIGKWVPLSYKAPSSIIEHGKKWIGPMWSQIDQNMILRYTPAKTQFTSGAQVTLDLRECPMVMAELAKIPAEARTGPLIINPYTVIPYRQNTYYRLWKRIARAAGIPEGLWNRDLRAGAATEGGKAGAKIDDMAKQLGHTNKRTTAEVYDRERLEAHRRVARARVAYRDNNGEGT